MQFNINTDAAVVLTNKLEQLHRSALPVAIRSTLNSAAFDVKKNTMLEESKQFINRDKNFFRATSKVLMAKGFNIASMKAEIGFVGGEKNQAVADLEQQEKGGTIEGRSFIPMNTARQSNSNEKKIRKPNNLDAIKKIRNIDKLQARTGNKNLFYKATIKTGVGGYIMYNNTLFQVKSVARKRIKLLPLFSYQKSRSVKVEATNFMQTASEKSAMKLDNFYKIEAKKQILRLKK